MYIRTDDSNKIVSADTNFFPDSTKVEDARGLSLVDYHRPYYYIDGVITHPERVSTWTMTRIDRDALLSRSDWRATIDYPSSDQQDWLDYRQKLRDIPQDYSDVEDVVWPTKPTI